MYERKKNAPNGIFDLIKECQDYPYPEYESCTYDWEIVYDNGDFIMYECFDGVEWARCYCATYKGKAYAYGSNFGIIRDQHDTACLISEFMSKFE